MRNDQYSRGPTRLISHLPTTTYHADPGRRRSPRGLAFSQTGDLLCRPPTMPLAYCASRLPCRSPVGVRACHASCFEGHEARQSLSHGRPLSPLPTLRTVTPPAEKGQGARRCSAPPVFAYGSPRRRSEWPSSPASALRSASALQQALPSHSERLCLPPLRKVRPVRRTLR
jgi:hypothetical protein